MGRSVSYPSAAQVVTFNTLEPVECPTCEGAGKIKSPPPEGETDIDFQISRCDDCGGAGVVEPDEFDFDCLIDDFRDHLRTLFPSVVSADEWIDREDHVLAENKLARFGMSEYCGLVSYWIVPNTERFGYSDPAANLCDRWIASIADKFVAAFGELSKVGSMSNGEGVYRRIDK
jgi:hypothetical protein